MLLQGCHPQIELSVLRDNFVTEAFELLQDDLIALLIDLLLNLIQVFEKGLLAIDYRIFRSLGLHLPLKLSDLFGEVRAQLFYVIDLLHQAQLHLVDRIIDSIELILGNATTLLAS